MRKNILLLVLLLSLTGRLFAQYYNTAFGLNGAPLKTALHDIIKNHTVLTYADLWSAFQQTDSKANNTVWDIYTDVSGGNPSVVFQFVSDQCGNYSMEGDCYNREHTWPKEKFGGDDTYPMYSDLHQVYPTDGWVNNKRAAYPYGVVNNASYTSQSNGSKLGTGTTYLGYSDKIFEPVDSFKGDLARTYFYMSTRYENEDIGWDTWPMANGAQLSADAIAVLMNWHHNDPVSQKEIDRNEAIAIIQHNRNPFIDYPVFADCIWGSADCAGLGMDTWLAEAQIKLYPNPAENVLMIDCRGRYTIITCSIYDLKGQEVLHITPQASSGEITELDIAKLPAGAFAICLQTSTGFIKKIFLKTP